MIRRSSVIFLLLMFYAFLAPLGNLARFGLEENALGATSIIIILISISSLRIGLRVAQRYFFFKALAIIIIWIIATSVFAVNPIDAFISGGSLVFYFLIMVAAFCYLQEERLIFRILALFCFGGLISSIVTVFDFLGFIHVPGVNESTFGTATDQGAILQASGPFTRRTAMAAYYTIVIASGLLMSLIYRHATLLTRFFFLSSALMCAMALILTHNRAGIISAVFSCVYIMLGRSLSIRQLLLIVLLIGLGGYGLTFAIKSFFPDALVVYAALMGIGDIQITDTYQQESDAIRFVLLWHSLTSMLSNPFGHGYSLLHGVTGRVDELADPHGMLTQVIWGAGLFGLVWIFYMLRLGLKETVKLVRLDSYQTSTNSLALSILGGLLSFFLTGLAHTLISTGIAWLLLGALLRLKTLFKKGPVSTKF